ncbi:MAG: anti-sigma factor domain-containing protein, partial [Pikeienuella sp.]
MDEREYLAAERALGHEPGTAESPEDTRLRAAWERRLAPLLAGVAPAAPPPGMLARIEAAIGGPVAAGAEIVDIARLRGGLRRWRAAALVAMAAAAALALYVAAPGLGLRPAESGARYVAVVTADEGGQAGLIIQFDTGAGVATVIPVTAPPAGNSYEMWTIPAGETRPV